MMKEVHDAGIRLLAAGSTLTLPVDTPYDRQLLAEHVSSLLRRHGAVRLSSGRRARWLKLASAAQAARCGHCLRPIRRAVQVADGEVACLACASQAVITSYVATSKSAA